MLGMNNFTFSGMLTENDVKRLMEVITLWGYEPKNFELSTSESNIDDEIEETGEKLVVTIGRLERNIPEYRSIIIEKFTNNRNIKLGNGSTIRVYDMNNKKELANFKKIMDVSSFDFYRLDKLKNYENLYKLVDITEEIKEEGKKLDKLGTIKMHLDEMRRLGSNDPKRDKRIQYIKKNNVNKDTCRAIMNSIGTLTIDEVKEIYKASIKNKYSYSDLADWIRLNGKFVSDENKCELLSVLFDIDSKYFEGLLDLDMDLINGNSSVMSLRYGYSLSDNDIYNLKEIMKEIGIDNFIGMLVVSLCNLQYTYSTVISLAFKIVKVLLRIYEEDDVEQKINETIGKFLLGANGSTLILNDIRYYASTKYLKNIGRILAYSLENYKGRSFAVPKSLMNDMNYYIVNGYSNSANLKVVLDEIFAEITKHNYRRLKKLKLELKIS